MIGNHGPTKRRKVLGIFGWLFALVGLLVGSANLAYAKHPHGRLSDELACSLTNSPDLSQHHRDVLSRRCSNNEKVNVIVQFVGNDRGDFEKRAAGFGAKSVRKLGIVRGQTYSLPMRAVEAMARHNKVRFITPDRPLKPTLDLVAPTVGATTAWLSNFDGTGIGIAVIDSGVADHAALIDPATGLSRVVYRESFVGDLTDTHDGYGHGTHVAGIIGSNGADTDSVRYRGPIKGIAPNANIIALKVLDSKGAGSDSCVIAALQRAIQLKDQYNIRVINLSVGRPVYETYTLDPLDQAVEAAYQAGITVVVAAGNNGRDQSITSDGHGTITAPGNDPYVITVGATKPEGTPTMFDDLMASYSSRGPSVLDHIVKPDLVAPGNQIISLTSPNSTLANTYPQLQVFPSDNPCSAAPASCPGAGSYLQISGTSMATPVVAGAAAILIQQDPTLTPDQVKARLMRNAWKGYPQSSTAYGTDGTPYFTTYDVFTVGAGYLDIAAALQDTSKPAGVAYSPAVNFDVASNTMKIDFSGAGAQTILWGTSVNNSAGSSDTILWGTSTVWGDTVFPTSSADTILWGTSTADTILWGTSSADTILWGTSSADTILWGTSSGDTILWGTSASATKGEN